MTKEFHVGLDVVAEHFQELDDPCSEINRQHLLTDVVTIAIMATIAVAGGPTAIARWARMKQELLLSACTLPNGIPVKNVLRCVLTGLKPQVFQHVLVSWLQSLRKAAAYD